MDYSNKKEQAHHAEMVLKKKVLGLAGKIHGHLIHARERLFNRLVVVDGRIEANRRDIGELGVEKGRLSRRLNDLDYDIQVRSLS